MPDPYQLASMIRPSRPAVRSAVSRPAGCPLAWMTTSASRSDSGGAAKARPNDRATTLAMGIHVDRGDGRARYLGTQPPRQQPDDAGAHDADRVANGRSRVPRNRHGRLHVGGQHRPARGHVVRNRDDAIARHTVDVLMGKETEDPTPPDASWVAVVEHVTDTGVAVLDRPGKLALLKRRPHRVILRGRHLPPEYQRFRPPADARIAGPHQHLPCLPGWQLGPHNLRMTG